MRINTNVSALTSLGNLNKVQNAVSSSMEKLSSGFRINRAGDDAAGLGISNQMGADIKAMTQASRNAEQAGSVLNIMDGAAQNVQSILERMKELAAQSASDTVDSSARTKINNEYQSLSGELDRIVSTTKFEGATLLNGTFGSKSTTDGTVKTSASSLIGGDVSGVTVTTAATYQNYSTLNASVVVVGETAPTSVNGDALTVDSQAVVNTLTSAPITLTKTASVATAVAATTNGLAIGGGQTVTGVTATTAQVTGDYTLHATANGAVTDFQLTGPGGYSSTVAGVVDGAGSVTFTGGVVVTLAGGKVQADYTALDGKKINIRDSYTLNISGGGATADSANIVDDGSTKNAQFVNYGFHIAVPTGGGAALDGQTFSVTDQLALKLTGVNANSGQTQTQQVNINAAPANQQLAFATFGVRIDLGAGATDPTLRAQINTGGKNQVVQNGSRQAQFLVSSSQSYTGNDLISLSSIDLTAATLGVTTTGVDLTTGTGAQAALTTIDNAISTVGTAIGAIGAAENRINYANQNVMTAIQNFTAAKSAIKDVDMAAEMTTFSKNQILSQAGTAMLAQANQLGASVLSLLRGG